MSGPTNRTSASLSAPKSPTKQLTKKQAAAEKSKNRMLIQKKSRFLIPPEVACTLTKEQRERKLKEIVVQTFQTARRRNERALKNKWLRWKYYEENNKTKTWLESNGVEDMGWAVGRRIYEKEEIEVTNSSNQP